MRWIEEKSEFEKIVIDARTCVYVDSRRAPTPLKLTVFDDVTLCTPQFASLLQRLMEWSGDGATYFLVVEPDPIHYFHRLFKKYPALEIAYGDSTEAYIRKMNEDPGGSPGDAVSDNYSAYVIVPASKRWFIHAIRSASDDSGHLWIPEEWVNKVIDAFPFVFRSG